jgi:CheY-like chemotaxis protein
MDMPRILVVDDEERYCKILQMMLRHADYEVATTTSGSEAMRMLEEEEMDVIVSDLFMSPVDGMEILRHRNSVTPDVPLVVLTAFGPPQRIVRIRIATKPERSIRSLPMMRTKEDSANGTHESRAPAVGIPFEVNITGLLQQTDYVYPK